MNRSATLSVVIAARNCVDRISGTVSPWIAVASEIIVVDQMSNDGTAETARKLGCKVIQNDPEGGNFDLNRKIGMNSATSDWILYMDTDERPTPELITEIQEFLNQTIGAEDSPYGVQIPNEFYFLGKPLRYGISNPRNAEIRMVRRGEWSYPCESGFHCGVSVKGRIHRFKHPYKHFNYNSVGEWFMKTNQYTELDACKKWAAMGKLAKISIIKGVISSFRFFIKYYFRKRGFLDGIQGFLCVFYFMLYHFTLHVKMWELAERSRLKPESDYLEPLRVPGR